MRQTVQPKGIKQRAICLRASHDAAMKAARMLNHLNSSKCQYNRQNIYIMQKWHQRLRSVYSVVENELLNTRLLLIWVEFVWQGLSLSFNRNAPYVRYCQQNFQPPTYHFFADGISYRSAADSVPQFCGYVYTTFYNLFIALMGIFVSHSVWAHLGTSFPQHWRTYSWGIWFQQLSRIDCSGRHVIAYIALPHKNGAAVL